MENIDLSALLGEPGSRHTERIPALTIESETLAARLRDIVLTFTNASGSLQVEFRFEYEALQNCVRCLTPFWCAGSVSGSEEFELLRPAPGAAVEAISEDDGILDDVFFDVEELIRQTVLTDLPLVPCCREDCAGLCPGCGANLNLGPCDCGFESQIESPLAAAFREAQTRERRDDGSPEEE